jgi:hypothetical protein
MDTEILLAHINDLTDHEFFLVRGGRKLGIRNIYDWSEKENRDLVVYKALTPLEEWESGSLQAPWGLPNPKAKHWTGVGWKEGYAPGIGRMGEVVDQLKSSCAPYWPAKVGDIFRKISKLSGEIVVGQKDLDRGYCVVKDDKGTSSQLVMPVFLVPRSSFRVGNVWQASHSVFQLTSKT